VEQTEAKRGLSFVVTVAAKGVWPPGQPPCCISKGPDSDGRVAILKHPDCPEADLADMKARFERVWQGGTYTD